MGKIKLNSVEKIIITIIIFVSILGMGAIVKAADDSITKGSDQIAVWSGVMPARTKNPNTGMFPQLFTSSGQRKLSFSTDYIGRVALKTDNWSANAKSNMVYCAEFHRTVQFGYFDGDTEGNGTEHYLVPVRLGTGGTSLQGFTSKFNGSTIKESVETIAGQIKDQALILVADKQYYKNPVHNEGSPHPDRTGGTGYVRDILNVTYEANWGNEDGWGILIADAGTISAWNLTYPVVAEESEALEGSQAFAKSVIEDVYEEAKSQKVVPDPDSETADRSTGGFKKQSSGELSAENGPKVTVMEQAEYQRPGTDEYGYAVQDGEPYNNDAIAYILSASEDAYKGTRIGLGDKGNVNTGKYGQKYDIYDIQTAFWIAQHTKNPGSCDDPRGTSQATAAGVKLWEVAQKYESHLKGNEPSVTIDSSTARVVADRSDQRYYVGPFTVNYPEIEDVCYLKALVLGSADNPLAVYDEERSDLTLAVLGGEAGMTTVIGSNGITKKYPKSGVPFFIEFEASKVAGLQSVALHARVEYVERTSATESAKLDAQAHTYQYFGYVNEPDAEKHPMFLGSVTFTVENFYKSIDTEHTKCWDGTKTQAYEEDGTTPKTDSNGDPVYNYGQKTHYANIKKDDPEITMTIWQPYIKMDDKPIEANDAQKLSVVTDAERVYKIKDVKAPVVTPHDRTEDIDLTMELGGYVWEEQDGGKEGLPNGTKDGNEKPIPGMKVELLGGGHADYRVTYTDSEGKYVFKGLDPMYKYSIRFWYNGQYYQPTYKKGSDTWFDGDWETNSNAADHVGDRQNLNVKFEKIGTSHGSYDGPRPGATESYTRSELESEGVINEFGLPTGGSGSGRMAQYVEDCMIWAYTDDEYPYPDQFVIGDKVWIGMPMFTSKYIAIYGKQPPACLYPNAYYINLGLDEREESDLSITKDVDHVTLEINGHTHTYTYDTLDKFRCKNCGYVGPNEKVKVKGGDNGIPVTRHCPICGATELEEAWDIAIRYSDYAFRAGATAHSDGYKRDLYRSDYIYKASDYNHNPELYGKSPDDELEVYVTYKVMVNNQSLSIRTRIDQLVDHYDEDYAEFVPERSYIEIKESRTNAAQQGIYNINATDNKGAHKVSIKGLQNVNYLAAGQTAYVYITFKVDKEADSSGDRWLKIDQATGLPGAKDDKGKVNTIEIDAYSTQYAKGTKVPNIGDVSFKPAGIVDKDSHSGYMTGREDDEDQAPNIRLTLYDEAMSRQISGVVFEDSRKPDGIVATGDGNRNGEPGINGVTVELVELTPNGQEKEFVWRSFGYAGGGANGAGGSGNPDGGTTESAILSRGLVSDLTFEDEDGRKIDLTGVYGFKSFMPGEFVVRFTYGDTVKTVLPSELGGQNAKSYNGQDYKSTLYQPGIDQPKPYTWRQKSIWNGTPEPTLGAPITTVTGYHLDNNESVIGKINGQYVIQGEKGYLYGITESDANPNASDAKDIESRRIEVNNYSANHVKNDIAEVLASHKVDYDFANRDQLLGKLIANTNMRAETGMMVIELEYDTTETPYGDESQGTYKINNVHFGLEERPKAQLAVNKHVTNVKLTLADGSVLFDAKDSAQNLLWVHHEGYVPDGENPYENNMLKTSLFENVEKIRTRHADNIGIVQLTMDEELMHGAAIEITYGITIKNVGEVDYYNTYNGIVAPDREFYYGETKSGTAKVVQTKADRIVDYVANNLQFSEAANRNYKWKVVGDDLFSEGLVNESLRNQVESYNTIIATDELTEALVPVIAEGKEGAEGPSSLTVPLVLTQMITSENDTDDLTYRNLIEIVETSNTVGRRMEYSIVGNQDPTIDPQEMDADLAEVVRILPPFGSTTNYYVLIAVSLGAVVMLIGGIIFIRKKLITK